MIAMLFGRSKGVAKRGYTILDVRGVGYAVYAPRRCQDVWSTKEEITVFISTQVREDSITLYGFDDESTKDAFETLIAVNGVGPKMGLAALDTLTVSELAAAVATDDTATLCKIPGIGKRKAQRMLVDLKGKFAVEFSPTQSPRARAKAAPADPLRLALAQLEYGKTEIDKALSELAAQGVAIDEPIASRLSAALRVLSGATL